ncbi:MAG: hypothetical protein JWQ38_1516 [Flavipsychrobacter sp.]|nr:hypothetical protein [Flavipsychrobacter sp.]
MKAHLILISILAFIAINMSACFLKPKFHNNDHRGVYKDMGVSRDQKAYLEELKRKNHPGRYRRKHHVKTHHLKEDHRAKKNKEQNNTIAPVDTTVHNVPVPPDPKMDTSIHTDLNVQPPPTPESTSELIHSTDQPTDPGKTSKKDRKKHKKNKQSGVQ